MGRHYTTARATLTGGIGSPLTLYNIEAEIRGLPPELRYAMRQQGSKPEVEALRPWIGANLAKVSKGNKLADALGYDRNH